MGGLSRARRRKNPSGSEPLAKKARSVFPFTELSERRRPENPFVFPICGNAREESESGDRKTYEMSV